MGHLTSEWQATDPVLIRFGKRVTTARKKYAKFIEDGILQGRRDDLTGGGLIRSVGGWKEVGTLRRSNIKHHSDERILGDSDFVEAVLKGAEEALERKHQYHVDGFGFDEALQQVSEIYKLGAQEIITAGKQPLRVQARSLLCFWVVREIGYSVTSVATRLGLTQPAVSRAVQRGERIVQEKNYSLDSLRKA
jgi:hypothetical protein